MAPVRPAQHRPLIGPGVCGTVKSAEAAPLVVDVGSQPAAAASRHEQVLPAITIDIIPAYARPQPAQATRQQGLPEPIVKRLLRMNVADEGTEIGEQRIHLRRGSDIRRRG